MDTPSSTTLTRARKYVTKRNSDPVKHSVRIFAFQAHEAGQQRVRVPAVPGVERAIEEVRREFPDVEICLEGQSDAQYDDGQLSGNAPVAQFLTDVYARSHGDQEALLELIYDTLDDLLLAGHNESCDTAIRDVDVSRLSTIGMIGFLTITLAASDVLPSRLGLVARVRATLLASRSRDEVEALLRGLT